MPFLRPSAIMALNQPTKRKTAFPGQNSAAARKRAKTIDARSLAVQSSEAALSVTGELDVAAYVKAREFEIRSLESGIQRSKTALTSRAFQQVPRSLRRRTASHNVKRVPGRLRARAKREVYLLIYHSALTVDADLLYPYFIFPDHFAYL